jgi:hypothetical protein
MMSSSGRSGARHLAGHRRTRRSTGPTATLGDRVGCDGSGESPGKAIDEVTGETLRQRYDSYLIDHYLSLHVTIVSVTLAVAGIGAAALLAPSAQHGKYQLLLWAMWGASLLAAADAYAGPMTGAILLPPRIPNAVDLALPLLLGVCEFVMFAVLGSQGIGAIPVNTILIGWWFAFAAFAVIAAGSVARAIQIVSGAAYEDRLKEPIRRYREAEVRDLIAASLAACISIAAGTLHVTDDKLSLTQNYALTGLAGLMLVGGFVDHRLAAKAVRAAIEASIDPQSPTEARETGPGGRSVTNRVQDPDAQQG